MCTLIRSKLFRSAAAALMLMLFVTTTGGARPLPTDANLRLTVDDSSTATRRNGYQNFVRTRRTQDTSTTTVNTILMVDIMPNPAEDGISQKDVEMMQTTLQEAYQCSTTADTTLSQYSIDTIKISTGGMICSYQQKYRRFMNKDGTECLYEHSGKNMTWLVNVQASILPTSENEGSTILLQNVPEDGSVPCPRLPTSDELASRWSQLVSEAGVTSILGFANLVEMEQKVECLDTETTNFTSYLIIDVEGYQDEISNQQRREVERLTVDLYNKLNALNKNTCDPFHRIVDNAKLTTTTTTDNFSAQQQQRRMRLLQEQDSSPSTSPTGRQPEMFSLVLQIDGRCSGCRADQQLFDEQTTRQHRRRLDGYDSIDTQRLSFRYLQSLEEEFSINCWCPIGAEEESGPDLNQFLDLLVDSSQSLDFITDIEEVRQDTCTRDDWFSVYLTLDLEEAASLEVADALATAVEESYNADAAEVCDPYGRLMTKCTHMGPEISGSLGRRMQEELESDMPSMTPSESTPPSVSPSDAPTNAPTNIPYLLALVYKIDGVCSGCVSDDFRLFDDVTFTSRSRFLELEPEDKCTCPFDESLEEEGPTYDGFLQKLNETIARNPATLAGVRVKSISVSNTLPSLVPSESPSSNPSISMMFPSSHPSAGPTTESPTLRPTKQPTPQPTERPSPAPTPRPTNQPTAAPTPQPTRALTSVPTPRPTERSNTGECCKLRYQQCFNPTGLQEECCDDSICRGNQDYARCEPNPDYALPQCVVQWGDCTLGQPCCPGNECVVLNQLPLLSQCQEVCTPLS
jgi:hypothetical protein